MAKTLGKGLRALIKNHQDDGINQDIVLIEKIVVNQHQPRKNFEDQHLEELIKSIQKNGIVL